MLDRPALRHSVRRGPRRVFSPLVAAAGIILSRRVYGPAPGRSPSPPIHSQFTILPACILCLTGLWPVATLIYEALFAGFADVASTASLPIPKPRSLHHWRPAAHLLNSGGFSAGPSGFRLLVKMQAAAASALGSPPSGSRNGARRAGPSGTALHVAREGPDFPRLARLAGDCPICPMRGLLPRAPRR
jgi:hypothetical protein